MTLKQRETHDPPAESTASRGREVFLSLFTPSWTLGLGLFACMFLPAYEGCNGNTVRIPQALAEDGLTLASLYPRFLIAWPFVLGLLVALGTIRLSWSRCPDRSCLLWWLFATLIAAHTVLVGMALLLDEDFWRVGFGTWEWSDIGGALLWAAVAILPPALLLLTYFYCRNWFNATMWLQLALAIVAAACLSFLTPAFFFAKQILIGGKLAITFSMFLIITTIVERLDGYRVLTRASGESPLRLSLRSLLLLMPLAGMACAWTGAYFFLDLGSMKDKTPVAVSGPK